MTFARRLSAATMALVLALFPVAMERCRTACVAADGQTSQVASSTYACHEASSDDENGSRMDPMARACGHRDEARAFESATLAPGKGRPIAPLTVLQPLLGEVPIPYAAPAAWAPLRSVLPHVVVALDLPLRL